MELHREEKREEGDRGDQEEKRGNQKGRVQSGQESNPYVLSTVWNTQRGSPSFREEKREEGDKGDQKEKRGVKRGETNLASNQFPMCSPQSGTPREVRRVT